MSSYIDSNKKMDWTKEFSRTYPEPLDRSSMFGSYADAVKYAAGNTADPDSRQLCGNSYIGQIITVYENDAVNTYVINSDRTLKAVGSGAITPATPTTLGGILSQTTGTTQNRDYVVEVDNVGHAKVNVPWPAVEDSVSSVSTTNPLSANQGKQLQDQITNLSSFGRFLSIWNAGTGLPTTEPTTNPYAYKTGDYYRVQNAGHPHAVNITGTSGGNTITANFTIGGPTTSFDVNSCLMYLRDNKYKDSDSHEASGTFTTNGTTYTITSVRYLQDTYHYYLFGTSGSTTFRLLPSEITSFSDIVGAGGINYKPTGTSYTGARSTVVETGNVSDSWVYYFDGTNWMAQKSSDYTLPEATTTSLGGVQIGSGVNVSHGVISVPVATSSSAGTVKPGSNLAVDADGTLNATDTTYSTFTTSQDGLVPASGADTDKFLRGDGQWYAPSFTVPIADATTVGGVKVIGTNGVQMTGTNSDELTLTPATSSQIGGVSVGEFLSATNGKIEVERPGCLGFWNCETGLADTKFYDGSSYTYKKGDYFRVIPRQYDYKHAIYLVRDSGNYQGWITLYTNSGTQMDWSSIRVWHSDRGYLSTQGPYYPEVSATSFGNQLDVIGSAVGSNNIDIYYWKNSQKIYLTFYSNASVTDTITPITNKKPSGSSYNGTASSAVESTTVREGQIYYYDGANWKLDYPIDTTPTASSTNLITSGAVQAAVAQKSSVSGTSTDTTNWSTITIDGTTHSIPVPPSIPTTSNLIKGDGAGALTPAEPGTDYQTPLTVEDNVSSTSAQNPLSANMGRALQEQITNLASLGRFLSMWNCATGLPTTDPVSEQTYTYHTGDYYRIGAVAESGGTNYKPDGSTYTRGEPSTTPESASVLPGWVYFYDGYQWTAQESSAPEYQLPPATSSRLGGIMVGSNLAVTEEGVLSSTVPAATTSTIGGVIVGQNLAVSGNGTISLNKAGCLGFWDCATGLATDPTSFYSGASGDSYTYKKGDYFRITNINSYKHSIYLQWGDISNNCYATVVINNNSLTAFTGDTLKSWLQTNGYTNNTKYTSVTGHYQTTAYSSDLYAVSYNTSSGNGNWWRTDIPTSGVQAWFGAFRSDTITGNQIPAGSSYNGTASTTRASVPLQDGQIYYYNGSSWQLEYIIDTTPTANSTHLITSGGVKSAIDAKPTVSGTNDGTNWTSITIDGNTKQIASNYVLPPATAGALGGILSQTTGTTAERDYVVEVDNTGNAKVNVPWTDTTYSTFTTSAAGLVPASSGSGETNKYLRGDGTWQDVSVTSGVASVNGKTGTVVLDETDIGITDFTAQEISDIFDEVVNVEVHADTITDAFVSIEDYDPTETANEGVLYYVTD